jgi:hypothetical protein
LQTSCVSPQCSRLPDHCSMRFAIVLIKADLPRFSSSTPGALGAAWPSYADCSKCSWPDVPVCLMRMLQQLSLLTWLQLWDLTGRASPPDGWQ